MKKLLLITCLLFQLKSFAFLNQTPISIAVHPKENYLIVGHKHGYITLIDSKTFKVKETKKIGESISKMTFSLDGNFLWVHGLVAKNGEQLFRVNTKDWSVDIKRKIYKVEWNKNSNRIFYTSSYGAKEITIIDMNSNEKVGGIQATFSDPEMNLEGIFSSSDGNKLILCGKKGYGNDEPGEILSYPTLGFTTKAEKTLKINKAIGNSFGYGLNTNQEKYLFLGWFNAFFIDKSIETKVENWNSCYTTFSASNGNFALASISEGVAFFNMESANFTKTTIEKIGAVSGQVIAFSSVDDKNIYYITDQHQIGIINESGFIIKQAVLGYKVNLVLRDEYKAEKAKEISEQLKKAGYKVEIPEKYDEMNRVIISKGVSVEKAIEMEEDIRNKTGYSIQTITEISLQ